MSERTTRATSLLPELAPTTTLRVPVANAELICERHGRGPLCLVPSAIGAEPYRRQLPAALAEHLDLVHVELRATGRSGGDPADLELDRLIDDLDGVRRHLGAQRVTVLGHSLLGALALAYARRRPEVVGQVIAVGAPPRGDLAEAVARGEAYFAAEASVERKRRLAENLALLAPGADPGAALFAETPRRYFDAAFDAAPWFRGASARPEALQQLFRAFAGWDAAAPPPPRARLLLLHGRHDYVVPWTWWQEVLPALPGATWRLFEQSGHQPFIEEPARFVAEVSAWLAAAR